MIEMTYSLLFITAIAFFILEIERASKIYGMISVISWLLVMGNSVYIQVPGIETTYFDWTMIALPIAFIFASIGYLLVLQFEWRSKP